MPLLSIKLISKIAPKRTCAEKFPGALGVKMTLKVVFAALIRVGGMNKLPTKSPDDELRSKRSALSLVLLLGPTMSSENSHEGH